MASPTSQPACDDEPMERENVKMWKILHHTWPSPPLSLSLTEINSMNTRQKKKLKFGRNIFRLPLNFVYTNSRWREKKNLFLDLQQFDGINTQVDIGWKNRKILLVQIQFERKINIKSGIVEFQTRWWMEIWWAVREKCPIFHLVHRISNIEGEKVCENFPRNSTRGVYYYYFFFNKYPRPPSRSALCARPKFVQCARHHPYSFAELRTREVS